MLRDILIITFIVLGNLRGNAQVNLLANGDFEFYVECPYYQNNNKDLNKAIPWYNPTNNTPDYFNICDSMVPPEQGEGVPSNWAGFQNPRSGVAYAGFTIRYASFDGRDYISTPLLIALDYGKLYELAFYVCLSNNSEAASYNIGAHFSSDSIIGDSTIGVLNLIPQVEQQIDSFVSDTLNWTKVADTFTAKGGERYLTIGNFYDDEHTPLDTFYYVPNHGHNVYYYIDDVSLYEVTDTQSNHPFLQHENAFGNIGKPIEPLIIPSMLSASSDVNWQFINLQENTSLKLYNAIGQLEFSTANYQNNLAVSLLAAGIYFYEVHLESGEMLKGKLVVIR